MESRFLPFRGGRSSKEKRVLSVCNNLSITFMSGGVLFFITCKISQQYRNSHNFICTIWFSRCCNSGWMPAIALLYRLKYLFVSHTFPPVLCPPFPRRSSVIRGAQRSVRSPRPPVPWHNFRSD